MDLDDMTPARGGSLRAPLAPLVREPVATFTQTPVVHPDSMWSPRGSEIAPPQPGRSIEHEPVDRAERNAQHTAQGAGDFEATAGKIRAALRPGSV